MLAHVPEVRFEAQVGAHETELVRGEDWKRGPGEHPQPTSAGDVELSMSRRHVCVANIDYKTTQNIMLFFMSHI